MHVELLQPSDRLRTEEEIAKEEKEKLESLEVSDQHCGDWVIMLSRCQARCVYL